MTEVDNEPVYGGHYRQVVLVQRCFSMTEVDNEPAYCGHYRQVVLGQISLHTKYKFLKSRNAVI